MVKLPPALDESFAPEKGREKLQSGLRKLLRESYGVEANVEWYRYGKSSEAQGGGWYLRLSYAVYNTREDVEKLKQAVLDVVEMQNFRCGGDAEL